MFAYSLISVIIVSLVSLIGVFTLSIKQERLKKYTFLLVSLAVGALLGDAFIHIIPEVFEESTNIVFSSLLVIVGIFVFFVIEKFLHWHHHGQDEHNHVHPVGKLVLISDGVHNLIDGLIIGASYFVSTEVGIATTIAVILHEIPQEIGDFAVLLHAGYTKKQALFLNFLSALLAVLGVLIALAFKGSSEVFPVWVLPIAAGGFIYIALSDLIPELHKTKEVKNSFGQIIAVILGIVFMLLLLGLE